MFMHEPHPSFQKQPTHDSKVWRYMDIARYISLLSSRSLHFANAGLMADSWEGSLSRLNFEEGPAAYGSAWEQLLQVSKGRTQQLAQRMFINCWHLSDHESIAMWQAFQKDGLGIAVQSSWGRLTSSLQGQDEVRGGCVEYVDYDLRSIPEGNAFDAFMTKRVNFEAEREVRLVTHCATAFHPSFTPLATDIDPDDHSTFLPPVIAVPVDMSLLVERIVVAPKQPPWVLEAIRQLTARFEISVDVMPSALDAPPVHY